ncbi:MAG: sialidase family protein [Candidatus Limnocylindrales bacterium]
MSLLRPARPAALIVAPLIGVLTTVSSGLLAAATAAVVVAASPSAALAASPNSSPYAQASWYNKYLTVSSGSASLCSGNSGSVSQPSLGANVDASHECGSQSETSIAIDPANPNVVIAGSNEIQRLPMRAMASVDGGAAFTGVDLPLPPPRTSNGFDFGSDPGLAFDSNGVAYYSYIVVFFGAGGGINGTEMAVARSSNHGATWTPTYFAPETGNAQFNDKPMITVDTGSGVGHHHNRIFVTWDHATGNSSSTKNGNNVLVSTSDDGGVTFSAPVSVSGPFTGKTGGIGADPYVAGDGTLHVAWQDYAHGAILDAASSDGGQTFAPPRLIAQVAGFAFNIAAQNSRGALVYPACGASGTTLYCSYMDGSPAATNVFVAKSTDGGSSWTSTEMPAGGDQFNQWLAVDGSDGSVNVAYYDTGTHGAAATTYTLARSTDGGTTWATIPVATAPTDETCCAPSVDLGNQYGDYEGLAAAGGTVRPVWTDRRAAVIDLGLREEVFVAAITPSP